jgi:RNA-binding protein
VIFVGQKGLTHSLAEAMDDALDHHELVKVKFIEFKEKEKKLALIGQIEEAASCEVVGLIGHVATLFRQHRDPDKRKIDLPRRAPER